MINKPDEKDNNHTLNPAPSAFKDSQDNINSENNKFTGSLDKSNLENNKFEVEYWFYFDKDEKFLLRMGEVKNKEKYQIRIELLNTEELSEEKAIYAENNEREELVQNLELGDKKNLDPKTYLARCTNFIVKKWDSNECKIQIMTDNNRKFGCVLKKSENKDESFFNMNAYRKILQMKKKVQGLIATLNEKNDNLKIENKKLKEELEKIKESNILLSKTNENISKEIKEVKETQEKAIDQLRELTEEN